MTHYSIEFVPICECCEEDRLGFLSVDHINGGGSRHIRNLGGNGSALYSHLIAEGYPEGYRVLCISCNLAIGAYGRCPHSDPTAGNPFIAA